MLPMKCPECGSGEIRQAATNSREAGYTTRKRVCESCGAGFFTAELVVPREHTMWEQQRPGGQSKPALRVRPRLEFGRPR